MQWGWACGTNVLSHLQLQPKELGHQKKHGKEKKKHGIGQVMQNNQQERYVVHMVQFSGRQN